METINQVTATLLGSGIQGNTLTQFYSWLLSRSLQDLYCMQLIYFAYHVNFNDKIVSFRQHYTSLLPGLQSLNYISKLFAYNRIRTFGTPDSVKFVIVHFGTNLNEFFKLGSLVVSSGINISVACILLNSTHFNYSCCSSLLLFVLISCYFIVCSNKKLINKSKPNQ